MPLSKIQTTNNQVVPNLGRRNIVMNGDMRIAQRGTAAVTTNASFTVDRWKNISNASDFSAQQSSTVPSGQGFYKSIYITPTSTKSPSGSTYFFTSHYVEGFNMGHLGWGTSGARTVTVSFWVRSSKTGIYSMGMKNAGATRSRQQEYTISVANTWEKKTITITGETSGTWPVDNTRGIAIDFCLAGSASATATVGSWISANSNISTNQVNFFDSTSNNFYLTGVQLEVGSTATEFEHRSEGEELSLCQRYLHILGDAAASSVIGIGSNFGTNSGYFAGLHPVEMRATPTLTVSDASHFRLHTTSGGGITGMTGSGGGSENTNSTYIFYFTKSSAFTSGGGNLCFNNASTNPYGTVKFDAEL